MKKASFRTYFIIYGIALVVSVVTGAILKISFTNFTTGLLDTHGSLAGKVITYVFRASLAFPIVYWFFQTIARRAKHDYPLSYRHPISGIFSIITGVSILVYTLVSGRMQVINHSIATANIFSDSNTKSSDLQSKILMLAVIILGAFACLSMIVGGLNKYSISGKPGAFLGFVPALWQFLILLNRFNNFVAVTTVTDNLLIVLFMCFASLFLIGQSRIIFGLGVRNGRTYALPTGLSVSLVGLNFILTNLICYLFTGVFATILVIDLSEILYMLSLSVYSVVFLIGFVKSIRTV